MNEKLENIFENEYSNDILIDFFIKTEKMYEFFGYNFVLDRKEINCEKFQGAQVWLNDDYKNVVISNLEIVSFNLVYPKILAKIAEVNLKNFNEVYSKLIDYYYNNKNVSIKKYINIVYGCLGNTKSLIYSKNIHLVPDFLNKILSNILSEFKGHIIYMDTDEIIFRNFDEIRERFDKYFNSLDKYELTYSTQKSKMGFFMGKKQYLIEMNEGIKIKGIKHFNKDGMIRGGFINLI